MSSELKVRIQWYQGAILPVLTSANSTASELSHLLRFACSPNNVIVLVHNGVQLDPDVTLKNQGIMNNDIIEAYTAHRTSEDKDPVKSQIRSLALEAAKISDQRLIHSEMREMQLPSSTKSSSDYDYYDFAEDEVTDSVVAPRTDPLPVFWKEKEDSGSALDKDLRFSTVEEAGKFLEQNGSLSWMWCK